MNRRKTLLLFLLLWPALSRAGQLSINTFRGLDKDNDPLQSQNGMSPDSRNVLTDSTEGLGPRMGFVAFSTETGSGGPWEFPHSNGTRYLVTQSSNILKATAGGGTFNIVLSTIDTRVRTAAVSLGDKFYWASSDGLKHWDTLNVIVDSRTLDFDNLTVFKGRLAGSGVSGDKRTIYLSEYTNGVNFALAVDPVETDPTRIQVQGSLDENIVGLYSSFKDHLMWFKANSFGGLSGSRRSNFLSTVYSANVGSFYIDTVQDCDGELRWLGSKRTVWGFDGASVYPLTKDQNGRGRAGIESIMSTLVQGEVNSRSITQTTQQDFLLGYSSGLLDLTSFPGDIFFPPQQPLTVPDDDFTDGDFTSNPAWTAVGGPGNFSVTNKKLILGADSIYTASTISTGTWVFDGAFQQAPGDRDIFWMMNSTNNICSLSLSIHISGDEIDVRDTNCTVIFSSTGVSGLSRITISRTADGVFFTSFTDTTHTNVPMRTYTDTTITYSHFIYFHESVGGGPIYVDSVTTTPHSFFTISTFTSLTFNIGNTSTRFSNFNANDDNTGAAIAYAIYTDTNANLSITDPTSFVASQTITSGQTPTISISSYVTIMALFTRAFTTQTATMHDFSLSWVDGNPLRAASLWSNRRYWLGVAIASPTMNNTVLVYDRNHQWQYWSGINMVGAAMYSGKPYFINSAGIFQAEVGYDDNGASIPSYFYTKAYYPGTPGYTSYFDALYIITSHAAETLQTSCFIDGKPTEFAFANLAMDTDSGYQDVQLPFSSTKPEQGNTIQFKFAVNGTSNWKLLNAMLDFKPEKTLHD